MSRANGKSTKHHQGGNGRAGGRLPPAADKWLRGDVETVIGCLAELSPGERTKFILSLQTFIAQRNTFQVNLSQPVQLCRVDGSVLAQVK